MSERLRKAMAFSAALEKGLDEIAVARAPEVDEYFETIQNDCRYAGMELFADGRHIRVVPSTLEILKRFG